MESVLPRGYFGRVLLIVGGSVLGISLLGLVTAGMIARFFFPSVFQLLVAPDFASRMAEIPLGFWWSLIGGMAFVSLLIGWLAMQLMPSQAKSQIWLTAFLLLLIQFQQFVGQEKSQQWVSLFLMLVVPTSFLLGARLNPKWTVSSQQEIGRA